MTDTPLPAGAMQIDPALVRQLADLLDSAALTEIEVQDGDRRIRVARKPGGGGGAAMPYAAAPAAAPPAASAAVPTAPAALGPAPVAEHPGTVKSPMVGTAYLSAEPGAKPFIAVGARIEAGATLLIVEAMKVMNPIASPRAGTVTQVLVANGQPVEFDQPLAVVE